VQWGHYLTYASLAESAAEGCYVCQVAWEGLSGVEQDSLYATEIRERQRQDSTHTTSGPLLEYVTHAVLEHFGVPGSFAFLIQFNEAISPGFPELCRKYVLFVLEKEAATFLIPMYGYKMTSK
jgi:hypothetical protein